MIAKSMRDIMVLYPIITAAFPNFFPLTGRLTYHLLHRDKASHCIFYAIIVLSTSLRPGLHER